MAVVPTSNFAFKLYGECLVADAEPGVSLHVHSLGPTIFNTIREFNEKLANQIERFDRFNYMS